MDPVTALTVAAAVVDFLDFGVKILGKANEIRKSADGSLDRDRSLKEMVIGLKDRNERLQLSQRDAAPIGPLTENDQNLIRLVAKCQQISGEMLSRLDKLKTKPGAGRLVSIKLALKSMWSEKDLRHLKEKLEAYRHELDSTLLVEIWKTLPLHDKEQWNRFQQLLQLDQGIKDTLKIILDGQDQLALTQFRARELIQSAAEGNERKLKDMQQATERASNEAKITNFIDSFKFDMMEARHEQIQDAYSNTFEWIYRGSTRGTKSWSNFVQWLLDPVLSLYWINGKAGSGKSTLMNFILSHKMTSQHLENWTADHQLIQASFFFWNSGSLLQKSTTGLLRSLIYQILSQSPPLVPIIYDKFETMVNTSSKAYLRENSLLAALKSICTQRQVQFKLFLLIDGLDEYDGGHAELATLLKTLTTLAHTKICVSSRPLIIFEKAFKGLPNLQLHDLTHDDINLYVHDRLDSLLKDLTFGTDNYMGDVIMSGVIDKAQGVFLWIRLVVDSLIRGIYNGDSLDILQDRVDELPSELEVLFSHMLEKVEKIYRKESSELFQFAMLDVREDCRLPAMCYAFASTTNVSVCISADIKAITYTTYLEKLRDFDEKLKARCVGLLEIVSAEFDFQTELEPKIISGGVGRFESRVRASPKSDGDRTRVSFIHRTARDYLVSPEVWGKIVLWRNLDDRSFDPALQLTGGCLLFLKSPFAEASWNVHVSLHHLQNMGCIARFVLERSMPLIFKVLDEMDRVISEIFGNYPVQTESLFGHRVQGNGFRVDAEAGLWGEFMSNIDCYSIDRLQEFAEFLSTMLPVAVENHLDRYIEARLLEDSLFEQKVGLITSIFMFLRKQSLQKPQELKFMLVQLGKARFSSPEILDRAWRFGLYALNKYFEQGSDFDLWSTCELLLLDILWLYAKHGALGRSLIYHESTLDNPGSGRTSALETVKSLFKGRRTHICQDPATENLTCLGCKVDDILKLLEQNDAAFLDMLDRIDAATAAAAAAADDAPTTAAFNASSSVSNDASLSGSCVHVEDAVLAESASEPYIRMKIDPPVEFGSESTNTLEV